MDGFMKKNLLSLLLAIPFLLLIPRICPGKSVPDDWMTDFARALQKAKTEKKLILMDFTGSDWCEWCLILEKDVFNQPEFKAYADKNIVLMKVDRPHFHDLPENEEKQNKRLEAQYNSEHSYPTLVVFNPEGKEIGMLGLTANLREASEPDALKLGFKFENFGSKSGTITETESGKQSGPKGLIEELEKLRKKLRI